MLRVPQKPDFFVSLDISGTRLRVVWKQGGAQFMPLPLPFLPYEIDLGDVEELASSIRATLDRLILNSLIAGSGEIASERKEEEEKILVELTRLGNQLYRVLFSCADGKPARQTYIDETIKRAISEAGEPLSICFLVPPRISVPWGLLCNDASYNSVANGAKVQKDSFWAVRHRISTVFGALADPAEFTATYEQSRFSMVWGADEHEFSHLKRELNKYAKDDATLNAFLTQYGEPVFSSGALEAAWIEHEKRLGLLYILAHSDSRTIAFSAHDEMNVTKFRLWAKKSESPPRCLVFLNGCSTTGMHERGTFLEATGRDGFCGYVGVEAVVPRFFAFRFGLAFKLLLHQGVEVTDALSALQTKHWPLGLVYGLYGFPHIRLEPHPSISLNDHGDENFSEGQLTVFTDA